MKESTWNVYFWIKSEFVFHESSFKERFANISWVSRMFYKYFHLQNYAYLEDYTHRSNIVETFHVCFQCEMFERPAVSWRYWKLAILELSRRGNSQTPALFH